MRQQSVIIRHPDGREFGIEAKDFTNGKLHPGGKSYADQGFRIVGHVDGTPYDGPKTLREIERAAEERQAAREQSPADKTAPKASGGR